MVWQKNRAKMKWKFLFTRRFYLNLRHFQFYSNKIEYDVQIIQIILFE